MIGFYRLIEYTYVMIATLLNSMLYLALLLFQKYTQRCSGIIQSLHSKNAPRGAQKTKHHIGHQILNPCQLFAREAQYPLNYFLSPWDLCLCS